MTLRSRIAGWFSETPRAPIDQSAALARRRVLAEADDAVATIRESLGRADRVWLEEIRNWQRVADNGGYELPPTDRALRIRRSRYYAQFEPLSKHTISLWTDFSFGPGFQVVSEDEAVMRVIDDFWFGDHNIQRFGFRGQHRDSRRLLIDGDLPLIVFGAPQSPLTIRWIDPLQISEVVTNPDDGETVWGYKREFSWEWNGKIDVRKWYYLDLNAPDAAMKMLPDGYIFQTDARMYMATFDSLGRRGNGLLWTTMDWAKAHKRFMEARVALEEALSAIAWKEKIKGTAAAVTQRIADVQSTLVTDERTETNPPPAKASVWVENDALSREQIKVDTGSGNAQVDANMLMLMVGVGAGIFPHWFGAGEAFRLATATAMEAPMLKRFESYQHLWRDIYDDLFRYALTLSGIDAKHAVYEIQSPPILQKDLVVISAAISAMAPQLPALNGRKMQEWMLTLLGVPDPQEVLDEYDKEQPTPAEEREARRALEIEAQDKKSADKSDDVDTEDMGGMAEAIGETVVGLRKIERMMGV